MILDPEAYEKAFQDTAGDMTAELRKDAKNNGWHEDVVNNISVEYSDSLGFRLQIHPDYIDRAFMHEYGKPGEKPTAVIRRFNSGHADSDKAFIRHLEKHSG